MSRRVMQNLLLGSVLVSSMVMSGCALLGGERSEAPLDTEALVAAPDVTLQELLNHAEFMSATRVIGQGCTAVLGTGQPNYLSERITATPPLWPDWAAMPALDNLFRHYRFMAAAQAPEQIWLVRETAEYPAPECHGPFKREQVARFLK